MTTRPDRLLVTVDDHSPDEVEELLAGLRDAGSWRMEKTAGGVLLAYVPSGEERDHGIIVRHARMHEQDASPQERVDAACDLRDAALACLEGARHRATDEESRDAIARQEAFATVAAQAIGFGEDSSAWFWTGTPWRPARVAGLTITRGEEPPSEVADLAVDLVSLEKGRLGLSETFLPTLTAWSCFRHGPVDAMEALRAHGFLKEPRS